MHTSSNKMQQQITRFMHLMKEAFEYFHMKKRSSHTVTFIWVFKNARKIFAMDTYFAEAYLHASYY